jgi:catechol 2,3-dioxygenase-like lactoylglutathione lyase family enzyme
LRSREHSRGGSDRCCLTSLEAAAESGSGARSSPTLEVTHIPPLPEHAAPKQSLALTSVLVREYDEALAFYVGVLGFSLIEDAPVPAQNKRWVVVAPPGAAESRLLLARAANADQESRVGNQTGGRVFLFLHTNDFWRDFNLYTSKGVSFVRPPAEGSHGTVAVFRDLYGNLWDLIQPKRAPSDL